MTRNSMIDGTFEPPYTVQRFPYEARGIAHMAFRPGDVCQFMTCCREYAVGYVTGFKDAEVTCLSCVICTGCPACQVNYICDDTMNMGKWESQDGHKLYPFEMDPEHLKNTIAKLYRDRQRFKKQWLRWLSVLEAEAALRRLS